MEKIIIQGKFTQLGNTIGKMNQLYYYLYIHAKTEEDKKSIEENYNNFLKSIRI